LEKVTLFLSNFKSLENLAIGCMKTGENIYEHNLLEKLRNDDTYAFSYIFTAYYANLKKFVFTFTKDPDTSEEIVQDVFLKLWENRGSLMIHSSLRSYLLKSAQNSSLDWLRHRKIMEQHVHDVLDHGILLENDTENYIFLSELEVMINKALSELPVEVFESFRMNRFDGLKYNEIATKLNVSVRTIEVRIGKALAFLRNKLRDYMVVLSMIVSGVLASLS
jgi:RNA polymerase sigma-70 factor (ECF subfamily)